MPDTALLTQPSTPIVQTHDLSVHYEDRSALRCVNIPIYPGETMGLLGPNGAGKSTLLKVIAGMLPPSHGHVTFRGEEITGSTPCITYVPQRSDADWTFPISVLEATMLGLAPSRSRWKPFSRQDRERTMHALEQVGMDHLAKAQIGALSGGQQQRVFLARALLACGEVLLLDEPFTGVDPKSIREIQTLIHDLRARRGLGVLLTDHSVRETLAIADRVVLMFDGRVRFDGTPEDFAADPEVRTSYRGSDFQL